MTVPPHQEPHRSAGYPYPPHTPYPPYPPYPPYGGYPPPTNAMAVASLVCAFIFAPLAIVFGHLSLSQMKRTGEQGRGMAVAGLVIGYVVTIGTILLLVVGVIFLSWAARIALDEVERGGMPAALPSTGQRALPEFAPPPGLGSDCRYAATPTATSKPAEFPRGGKVSTDPPVLDASMSTNAGVIGLKLDNAKAPCTVNSFVSLARQRFFDNTPCHRLSDGPSTAMLQCGDPTGSGSGGAGYRFANEYPTNQYRPLDPALREPVIYPRGTLAMANAGPDSNGSQFFIVYRDSALAPTYTVFGRVDEAGLAAVDRLAAPGVRGGGEDGEPAKAITITSLTVK